MDREEGKVHLDLSNGEDVTLVFPRSSLASFREGDSVAVTAHVGMAQTTPSPVAQERERKRDED